MARSSFRWIMVIVVVAVIVGGVFAWQQYFVGWESTDDAQVDGHINPVASRIAGTILAVHVTDNQMVEAGTVLVEIDKRDYEIAVASARASLADAEAEATGARAEVPIVSSSSGTRIGTAEAGQERAKSGVEVAEKELLSAQARKALADARVREAEANATKAQRDLERMEMLVKKDEISRQQYDSAVANAQSAAAAVESAQAAVVQAEHEIAAVKARGEQARASLSEAQAEVKGSRTSPQEITVTRARASSAEARVKLANATLEQALLDLENAVVKAPVSGVVSKKSVEIGQVVQRGQPLLAIIPDENVWVTANFKETQLAEIRPGAEANVSVDAYGGREFKAHVDSIASATGARFSLLPPENATGNYVKVVQRVPVKLVFDEATEETRALRPGMSVVVTVTTK